MSISKGIETKSLSLMCEVLEDLLGDQRWVTGGSEE